MTVAAIVNPISGAGAGPRAAARRVALLRERFAAAGVSGEVYVTERPRHAVQLAASAIERGVHTVLAWGGDGTMNEVGSVLAGTNAALGVIPAGSGNGLANALGVPRDPRAAIDAALAGPERLVDAGEINGRLFFNIAGIGIDARIARRFNATARGRRLALYFQIGLSEAFRFQAAAFELDLEGERIAQRALLIAFANGREYGNGLCIAPAARLDDGRLEAVVVGDRSRVARVLQSRHLLVGRVEHAPGVLTRSIQHAEVRAAESIPYHVDGEQGAAGRVVNVAVRPGYLRVRVPPDGRSRRWQT